MQFTVAQHLQLRELFILEKGKDCTNLACERKGRSDILVRSQASGQIAAPFSLLHRAAQSAQPYSIKLSRMWWSRQGGLAGGLKDASLAVQAHFKLAWRSADGVETTHRHRHEIVSYERGNISNMARSNKQVGCCILRCALERVVLKHEVSDIPLGELLLNAFCSSALNALTEFALSKDSSLDV
jgi:hypothetical protein